MSDAEQGLLFERPQTEGRAKRAKPRCPWCSGPVHRPESAGDAARHIAADLDWLVNEQTTTHYRRTILRLLAEARCLAKQLEKGI